MTFNVSSLYQRYGVRCKVHFQLKQRGDLSDLPMFQLFACSEFNLLMWFSVIIKNLDRDLNVIWQCIRSADFRIVLRRAQIPHKRSSIFYYCMQFPTFCSMEFSYSIICLNRLVVSCVLCSTQKWPLYEVTQWPSGDQRLTASCPKTGTTNSATSGYNWLKITSVHMPCVQQITFTAAFGSNCFHQLAPDAVYIFPH